MLIKWLHFLLTLKTIKAKLKLISQVIIDKNIIICIFYSHNIINFIDPDGNHIPVKITNNSNQSNIWNIDFNPTDIGILINKTKIN